MKNLTINCPVTIKVIVTEDFKRKLASELQENLRKIESDLHYLEFQSKRMISELEKQNPQGIPAAKQHLDSQKNKRLEAKTQITERLKDIAKMAIGSEIVHSTVESIREIKVGDSWSDILGVEIIVRDEVIIEFREKK